MKEQVTIIKASPPKPGFKKGTSGNPKGRPKGSKNKATVLAETLLEGEALAVTRKCIDLALEGDRVALRLCMERLVPPKRSSTIRLDLPEVSVPESIGEVQDVILRAVSSGEITLDDATKMTEIVEVRRRTMETVKLAQDLELLKDEVGRR